MTERPLDGKTAVITGATAGIGLYSLIALAQAGASVIGVGRSAERCKNAEAFVLKNCPDAEVKFLLADLSLQSQVRKLAGDIRRTLSDSGHASLDVLVNNAGLYSQKRVLTAEGIELTLAVNHMAVFLLTHELLPLLSKAPDARVITVSSASHYRPRMNFKRITNPRIYIGFWAYSLSKLANVLFTSEFNRRYRTTSMHAFAVDPGLVNTEIGVKERGALSHFVWKRRMKKGMPPEIPARTVLFLSHDAAARTSQEVYWRDSRPKAPNPEALREDIGRDLWELSDQLCGIKRKLQ